MSEPTRDEPTREERVMTITMETNLADLVTAHPSVVSTLERHRLDYCCGGRSTLGEACAESGVDTEAIVAELRAEAAADPGRAPWADLGIAELADHIEETHHRHLDRTLPMISDLLAKVCQAHGARHPELAEVARTFADLRAELEPHMRKEEQVLFPMIRELPTADELPAFGCGTVANPISVMMAEHDRARALLEELSRLTDGHRAPSESCASLRACYAALAELEQDTHLHMHKENSVLFPAVLAAEQRLRR